VPGGRDRAARATEVDRVLMGQSYKQCTACGARALRIATRCPGCHREFPSTEPAGSAPAGRPESARPGSSRTMGLAAGVLVLAAILIGTELSQTGVREIGSAAPADSAAASAEVAYVSNGGTVAPAPGGSSAPAAPSRPQLRVARTWTHVRSAPRRSAALEAVLTPGDTVLADSLQRGWYRVALDGEVLGYAYQSTLALADSLGAGAALTP
jgi:hypothetical protein